MSDKNIDNDLDPFISNEIFPEADALFNFEHKSIKEIYEKADIVLDTNVLLILLNTGSRSLKEVEKIYSKLIKEERLYIPAQVAREYAKNKPEKIRNLYHHFSQKKQININTSNYPLFEGLDEYKQIEDQEKILLKQFEEYSKRITKILAEIKEWGVNDPVSKMYGKVGLGKRIIPSNLDLNKLLKDKNKRYLHKLPPGYKDAHKDDGGIGDYIIWSEILTLAEKRKNNLIFVSGEEKSDWWSKSTNSELHVRYELIDEYRRKSDGKSFHIINFSKFLELFGAETEIISQVKVVQSNIEEVVDKETKEIESQYDQGLKVDNRSLYKIAETAALAYIKDQLNKVSNFISFNDQNTDFAVHGYGDAIIGYEVRIFKTVSSFKSAFKLFFVLGDRFRGEKEKSSSAFRMILVTTNIHFAIDAMSYMKNNIHFFSDYYGAIIGYIDSDSKFREIYRSYPESFDNEILLPF